MQQFLNSILMLIISPKNALKTLPETNNFFFKPDI